jgi:xylulose-5-phosphate/fructose-6-phosphate phosphoketolase
MRSEKPEELFDAAGKLRPELKELAPTGARRMSANPHANGGILKRALRLPDFRDYAFAIEAARKVGSRKHASARRFPARRDEDEHEQLPRLRPR